MTDRLITNSQELRAEGEELDSEIWRHANAFYDRICRMQQRLHAELNQLEQLRRKFEWSMPKQQNAGNIGQGQGLQEQRRALQAVQHKEKDNG